MKTNFSLLFYLKKPKNYVKGLVPIYLRITVDGKRAELCRFNHYRPANVLAAKGTSIEYFDKFTIDHFESVFKEIMPYSLSKAKISKWIIPISRVKQVIFCLEKTIKIFTD